MDEMLHVTLGGGLDAPRLVRSAARVLNDSLAELRAPVILLVSDLVAKVVARGATSPDGTLSLRLDSRPDRVRVEVSGAGTAMEGRPRPRIDPIEDGFGLALLDQLADRWGVKGDGDATLWFEIDRAPV
jgi:hypothetical protein